MIDAVKHLHEFLEIEGFEPMNIIMNEEIEQVDVPKLRLRNVSGPDALQLLAAAAIKPCRVEAIISEEYIIVSRGKNQSAAKRHPVIGYSVHLAQISRASTSSSRSTPPRSSRSTGQARRTVEATPSPESPTRVYPMARITVYDKSSDVMDTLKAVLEADGIDPKDAKISLHEKTNVILVHGPEKVHKLVKALLESLATNTAKNEAIAVQKETKRNEARIPHMERELKMLSSVLDVEQRRRESADTRTRKAEQELERLKNKQAEPEK